MNKIFLLTDYLGRFGSKHDAVPYKSGMNLELLHSLFSEFSVKAEILSFAEVQFSNIDWKGRIVLYTSQEDSDAFYKGYIEDVIYFLELQGAVVIPRYALLRAHENKVFMEFLRLMSNVPSMSSLESKSFGTYKEAIGAIEKLKFPIVVKAASGSMSSNVELARTVPDFKNVLLKLMTAGNWKKFLREKVRAKKYKGYLAETDYRKKIIVQEFLPKLSNDWKVLVFGKRFYIFERGVRKDDFRASGSGQHAYLYGTKTEIPEGIFDAAKNIKEEFNVPFLSVDFALFNNKLYVIEFQFLYFGTVGQWRSDCYFEFVNNEFRPFTNSLSLEKVYVDAVIEFVNENSLLSVSK